MALMRPCRQLREDMLAETPNAALVDVVMNKKPIGLLFRDASQQTSITDIM
jgi:hypothetical protein